MMVLSYSLSITRGIAYKSIYISILLKAFTLKKLWLYYSRVTGLYMYIRRPMVMWLRNWLNDRRVTGSIPETTNFLTTSSEHEHELWTFTNQHMYIDVSWLFMLTEVRHCELMTRSLIQKDVCHPFLKYVWKTNVVISINQVVTLIVTPSREVSYTIQHTGHIR